MTSRYNIALAFPPKANETDRAWAKRVQIEGKARDVFRQCSLGVHEECTLAEQRNNPECPCACLCHIGEA